MSNRKYATAEERRLAKNRQQTIKRHQNGGGNPEGRPLKYRTVEEAKAAKAENQRFWRAQRKEFQQKQTKTEQNAAISTVQSKPLVTYRRGKRGPRSRFATKKEANAAAVALEKQHRHTFAAARLAAKEAATTATAAQGA